MTTGSTVLTVPEVAAHRGAPLYLFVGVSTGGSAVHQAFPTWAALFAPDAELRGVDLPETDDPAPFRALVEAMRDNPDVHGAVVTSHKLRLYRACSDLFDRTDPLVGLTHEVNSLDTRSGVSAFARDAQSLAVLDAPLGGAAGPAAPALCLGSGGSAIALLLRSRLDIEATLTAGHAVPMPADRTGALTVVGRREAALAEIGEVAERCGIAADSFATVLARDPAQYAALTSAAAPGTVIINATGLGKTAPGSPLPDAAAFPTGSLAWDFNYRGPLTFLAQAREAGVPTEDGWLYFLAGWSCALAAITGGDAADLLAAVSRVSDPFRPTPTG
ncbi:hypothetical protein JL107_03400 [Nakamurella flavida]|uniref:Shikimate dehydrogenase n=1 Tax=Nakamurella flavida TaxID=363630 RepID=A0A939BZ87_9ACTN|nr:hypothetical protein [Nakamurella flavida]MBM9475429.1 hypothetical protein [Nakamurella flavida]MBM9475483.1 hypothetical protein [Nakamurella flavida]MDP9777009.1 shikimate 5-dehydrogenase [Nakamurella flavida]